jgi:hypothetical protein
MYLVYTPTGDRIFMGKRMGLGWYGTPEDLGARILELFEKAEVAAMNDPARQDDFVLEFEDR